MKILLILSLIIVTYSIKTDKKRDLIGEAYNLTLDPGTKAASYSKAKANDIELPKEYKKPLTVPFIPDTILPPPKGPLETIEEIPTQVDYYDGDIHLNKIDIKCTLYPDKSECISHDNCGWCGQNNQCILGNPYGPLEPCINASYIYATPLPKRPLGDPLNSPLQTDYKALNTATIATITSDDGKLVPQK